LDFPITLEAAGLGAERRFRVTTFAARFLFLGGADGFRAAAFFPGLAFFFDAGMGSSYPLPISPKFVEFGGE
jgi:hypothetical protein